MRQTMRSFLASLLTAALLVVALSIRSAGADGTQLRQALDSMVAPSLDEATGIEISGLTLTHTDLTFTLEKGTLYFIRPLTIDTTQIAYGAFFFGNGKISFTPKVPMEQSQLRRFFEADRLEKNCQDAMILFTGSTIDSLLRQGKPAKALDKKRRKLVVERFEEFQKFLTIRQDHSFLFSALKNIASPRKKPYLLINTNVGGNDQIFYLYDPHEREEVRLHKYFKQFTVPLFMEPICAYSIYADSTYTMLNGTNKAQISPTHYDIATTIDRDGFSVTAASMRFQVELTPVQMIQLSLNERLAMDSIRDGEDQKVEFYRWTNERYRHEPLLVILPEPLSQGATGELRFYYHGDMIRRRVADLYSDIGGNWYPIYDDGYTSPATYSMSFRSPADYGLVASGSLVSHEMRGDTVVTGWKSDSTVFGASFLMGKFTRYQFTLDSLPTVDVYFLEKLHRDSTEKLVEGAGKDSLNVLGFDYMSEVGSLGRNMHEQVANDLIAALRLFSDRFGALKTSRIAAAELLDTTARGFYAKRFGSSSLPGVRYSDQNVRSDRFSVENIGLDEDTMIAERFDLGGKDVTYQAPVFPDPSYPNLLPLRFETFQKADKFGREARYRAHGVAEQWFGEQIAPQTYHDIWLSEGISAYCALLFVQASRGNDQFLYWLNQHQRDLKAQTSFMFGKRQDIGALALGPRAATTLSRDDYELLAFRKAPYVIHMLRNMLLDLETLDESRFFNLLRDYLDTFRGRRVTTADFRAIVEKHTGVDMGWFFDQWVYGTAIPNYKFSYKITDDPSKGYYVSIKIEQKDVPGGFKMYVPIEIEMENGDKQYARVLVDSPLYEEQLPIFASRPKKLKLNPFNSVLAKVEQ